MGTVLSKESNFSKIVSHNFTTPITYGDISLKKISKAHFNSYSIMTILSMNNFEYVYKQR